MKTLLSRAGVSRAVAYGVFSRLTAAVFALAGVLLIAWTFAPEAQGYYYTFQNLLVLQVFAELGLGMSVTPFASHQWARLRLEPDGSVGGDPDALSRLVGLGRVALVWYAGAGAAMALGLAVVGSFFFSRGPAVGVDWQGPWLALCAAAGLRLWTYPFAYLLEGCNQVAAAHFFRWGAALFGGATLVAALLLGAGLWAPALVATAETLWGAVYFGGVRRRFLRTFFVRTPGPSVEWRRDVLPLQARLGASWICGFFIFHLFGPALFHFQGPAVAGRWGMTWSMFLLVTSVATLWVSTRAPQFGIWIAGRDFATLDRQYRRSAALSVAVAAAGAGALLGGIALLHAAQHPLSDRVLPPSTTAVLAAALALSQVTVAQAFYLRAHGREPLVGLSVLQAALTTGATLVLAPAGGAAALAAGHLAIVAFVVVPLSTAIWRRRRVEWHAAPRGT